MRGSDGDEWKDVSAISLIMVGALMVIMGVFVVGLVFVV